MAADTLQVLMHFNTEEGVVCLRPAVFSLRRY